MGLLPEEVADDLLDLRDPRRTTDQDHLVDLRRLQTRVLQRLLHRLHRTLDQVVDELLDLDAIPHAGFFQRLRSHFGCVALGDGAQVQADVFVVDIDRTCGFVHDNVFHPAVCGRCLQFFVGRHLRVFRVLPVQMPYFIQCAVGYVGFGRDRLVAFFCAFDQVDNGRIDRNRGYASIFIDRIYIVYAFVGMVFVKILMQRGELLFQHLKIGVEFFFGFGIGHQLYDGVKGVIEGAGIPGLFFGCLCISLRLCARA